MAEVLIPFAIDKHGRMVEVFDVPRGQNCDCRCPSCGQSVIARQGERTAWHFAHDPNANEKPSEVCELSFYSCCRMYLIEQAVAGELSRLHLPKLSLVEHIGRFQLIHKEGLVTQARNIEIVQYLTNGPLDLETKLGHYTLAIHIQYPGREIPEIPNDKAIGVLVVDITLLESLGQGGTGSQTRILPILKALFNGEPSWSDSVRWLYHPRTETVRAALREALTREYDPTKDQPQPDSISLYHTAELSSGTPQICSTTTERDNGPIGTFRCLNCQCSWEGHKFLDATCSTCRTHLYSRFEEKS